MNWIEITSDNQFEEALKKSESETVVFFKHSTRCSISSSALNRIERNFKPTENVNWLFLDLIKYRTISNLMADTLNIEHQSPQVLVVKDRACIFSESHYGISFDEVISNAV